MERRVINSFYLYDLPAYSLHFIDESRTATSSGYMPLSLFSMALLRASRTRASSVDISFEHKYAHTTGDFNIKQIIVIPRK